MKKLAILATALVALPVCAHADHRLRAVLTGYQEVPSVSTQADGVFDARVSTDEQSVEFALAFEGLQATVQQAHIHFAQQSVNGPIIIWLCGTSGTPGPAGTQTCPQTGTVRGTFTSPNVLASPTTQQLGAGELLELIQAMRAGAAYVNVHTAVSPAGEIRGQIKRLGHGHF